MDESMRNVVLMFVGIALVGTVVALLDWAGAPERASVRASSAAVNDPNVPNDPNDLTFARPAPP
jgi:hypothetical protein